MFSHTKVKHGSDQFVGHCLVRSLKNLPASAHKMKAESSDSSKESNDDELEQVNGFRLNNIAIIAVPFV